MTALNCSRLCLKTQILASSGLFDLSQRPPASPYRRGYGWVGVLASNRTARSRAHGRDFRQSQYAIRIMINTLSGQTTLIDKLFLNLIFSVDDVIISAVGLVLGGRAWLWLAWFGRLIGSGASGGLVHLLSYLVRTGL